MLFEVVDIKEVDAAYDATFNVTHTFFAFANGKMQEKCTM